MTKKKIGIIVGIVAAIVLAYFVVDFIKVMDYRKKVDALKFETINISEIPDGLYTGSSDVGLISATVGVKVEAGRIESIEIIEHNHGRGAAAEPIIDEMVERQTTKIDSVTGATNSGKVLRNAVENALMSAK